MAHEDPRHKHVQEDEKVERELVIPAPVTEVWEIVTGDGWLADEVSFELVPGGEARFTDGDELRTGWVEHSDLPTIPHESARLVFWWENGGDSASRVELVLEPEDERVTRLWVTESRPLEALDLRGIPLSGPGNVNYGPSALAVA